MQFAITRVAVPRCANGPDPEPPLGVHEHESSGDRREHPLVTPYARRCWMWRRPPDAVAGFESQRIKEDVGE